MKKLVSLVVLLCSMSLGGVNVSANVQSTPVCLTYGKINNSTGHVGGSKSPESPMFIDLDDNVISMEATPCDYTLNLYDEDEAVVYSVFVPAGTTQVILPTTLSGSFELRFETDTYYYYGFIYL